MLKRLVNLPFTVASRAARAFQEREDAKTRQQYGHVHDPGEIEVRSAGKISSDIDAATFQVAPSAARAQKAVFLDVREGGAGGIPGSMRMPMGTIGVRVSELPSDQVVIVWCDDGRLATEAVRFFRERGMEDTFALTGGLAGWRAAGGETE